MEDENDEMDQSESSSSSRQSNSSPKSEPNQKFGKKIFQQKEIKWISACSNILSTKEIRFTRDESNETK